ncbi:FliM/FliN family flagellar motor switch protein [Mesorhizobium sp. SP-1A]|uniref:FliM/FliN family flagellar motor switch protein n=1 Tax=Mesorhizobium sp. SP-1A TaxID=3077840 RepID=UPI0028F6F2D5|nr:FliM/FliN family flagellar motor switch protein [Mesorhizobium sp. SP-1A]
MTANTETSNLENTMSENENNTKTNLSPFDEIQPVDGPDGTAREAAMSVPVNVEVVVGRSKITVAEIMDTRRGKVLELDSKAGDLVDITVNGKVLARGELNVFDDGRVGVTFVEIL